MYAFSAIPRYAIGGADIAFAMPVFLFTPFCGGQAAIEFGTSQLLGERRVATVWITYAWSDNATNDIDFVAQELEAAGVTVKLDRWVLKAGERIWEELDRHIADAAMCDAWIIYATPASLGSEACREEIALALDRALAARTQAFPLITLFADAVDRTILPGNLRVRLCVSLHDGDWIERAAAEGRSHNVVRTPILPFHAQMHDMPGGILDIEMRPRAGVWMPFTVAVPAGEADRLVGFIPVQRAAAGGRRGQAGAWLGVKSGVINGWAWWQLDQEATPAASYYLSCSTPPSTVRFGVEGDLYEISLCPA